MAAAVEERFGGEVPSRLEDLVTLPGVGRKTANVVRSVAFDLPGLPVDTHVGRLSRRLGLTTHDDPVKVELELNGYLPAERAGPLQPAHDPPRPPGLSRPVAAVRRVRARGHLSVEPAADPPPAPCDRRHIRGLELFRRPGRRVTIDDINQDPATWVAATAGIRRLASPERRPLS